MNRTEADMHVGKQESLQVVICTQGDLTRFGGIMMRIVSDGISYVSDTPYR
jgi:hypothetical protein